MSTTLLPIQQAGPPVLAAVNCIYQEAFEEYEKVEFERLLQWGTQARDTFFPFFYAALQDGEVLGMAVFGYLLQERLGYLGYIAIRSDQRGRGLGEWLCRKAFDAIGETALQMHGELPLCTFWETRDPRDATHETERQERLRRQRFYQKLGAYTLPLTYIPPALRPGLPVVPYQLMVHTHPPGRWLTREQASRVALIGLVQLNHAEADSDFVAAMYRSLENYPEQMP
jgi:GNAT superfamily N-acetyltransferase